MYIYIAPVSVKRDAHGALQRTTNTEKDKRTENTLGYTLSTNACLNRNVFKLDLKAELEAANRTSVGNAIN